MANIATVFVRAEPLPGCTVTAEELLAALIDADRGTYHVPVWHGTNGGVVDVQFGDRWSGGGALDDVWDAAGERLRSVWVRYYDSGADVDVIGHRTASGSGVPGWRACDYAFDEVRVTYLPGAVPDLPGGVWHTGGRRRAANDRCEFGDAHLDSPTTPASAYAHGGFLELWRIFGLPALVTDTLEAQLPVLESAALLLRGRPVEVARRVAGGPRRAWARWSLDDWDSCADPAFAAHFPHRPNPLPETPA